MGEHHPLNFADSYLLLPYEVILDSFSRRGRCGPRPRWSRMLAHIWLKRNRRPITEWPEQVISRESPVRDEYLQGIRAADAGDYEPLFELHRRFTANG
jgi:hypothetical protein